MNEENKNLLLAMVICVGILMAFQYLVPQKPVTPVAQTTPLAAATDTQALSPVDLPHASGAKQEPALISSTEAEQPVAPRVKIRSLKVSGSLNMRGARLDDLSFSKYRQTLDADSPDVALLASAEAKDPYYAEFGWVSANSAQDDLPNSNTVWLTNDQELTPETPVTVRWMNKHGVVFEKVISLDEKYMFTIVERVTNNSNRPLNLFQYGLLLRAGTPPVSDYFVSYEGPMGYINGKKQQHSYADLLDEKKISYETTSGWLGFSDKYWLGALILDPINPVKVTLIGSQNKTQKRYQLDYVSNLITVAPTATFQTTSHFFVGPKKLDLLDAYEQTHRIPHFDLAVDFGWFYFITKPIFYILTFLHDWLGNFGLAIMVLTVLMRLLFLPIANKAFKSMGKMKALQPEMNRIKQLYADDKVKQQQEIMDLFKKYKVNPASGCLPMLIQIPVFFALYKVIFISIEMRHAPFYGWIKDLSVADPTNIFTLFGLIAWTPPSFMHLGLLPLLMGATMFLQQRLNPQPMDEAQKTVFALMPIIFTFVLAAFPAGLLLYWTWTNILGMIQQTYIMRLNSSMDVLAQAAAKKKKEKK